MKKFERRDDSKLHSYIGFCWPLTIRKMINQKHLNPIFVATFRVLSLPGIISTTIFFDRKPKISLGPRLNAQVQKRYSWVHVQTVIYSE